MYLPGIFVVEFGKDLNLWQDRSKVGGRCWEARKVNNASKYKYSKEACIRSRRKEFLAEIVPVIYPRPLIPNHELGRRLSPSPASTIS